MFITKAHEKQLVAALPRFLKSFNLSEQVLACLGANYTLKQHMRDEIEAKPTNHKKISMLFQYLEQGTEEGYATFVEALVETRQDDLAEILDATLAEKLIRKRNDECAEKPSDSVQVTDDVVRQDAYKLPAYQQHTNYMPAEGIAQTQFLNASSVPEIPQGYCQVLGPNGYMLMPLPVSAVSGFGLPQNVQTMNTYPSSTANPPVMAQHSGYSGQRSSAAEDSLDFAASMPVPHATDPVRVMENTVHLPAYQQPMNYMPAEGIVHTQLLNASSVPEIPQGYCQVLGPNGYMLMPLNVLSGFGLPQNAQMMNTHQSFAANTSVMMQVPAASGFDLPQNVQTMNNQQPSTTNPPVMVQQSSDDEHRSSVTEDSPDFAASVSAPHATVPAALCPVPSDDSTVSETSETLVKGPSEPAENIVELTEMDLPDDAREIEQYKKEVGGSPIMEIKFKKLSEEQLKKLQAKGVYPMRHETHGRVLIISNEYFTKMETREATKYDEENLKNLFVKLKFQVQVERNKSVIQIRELLEKEVQWNHSCFDAFILVILSHGSQGNIYGVDDNPLPIDDIISYFEPSKCKQLENKPKIFIIQACQGEKNSYASPFKSDGPFQSDSPEADSEPDNYNPVHEKADALVAYSTVKGYMAWRHYKLGSCYIRSLIYVFKHYAHELHFQEMLTKLNYLISQWKDKNQQGRIVNLMAQSESRLTRSLFFSP